MAIDKYKLKNGQTRYRVSVYVNGVRVAQKRGFEKLKDARAYEAKIKARGKVEKPWTYQEIEDLFLESYEKRVVGSTYYETKKSLMANIPKDWRRRPIKSIKLIEIQKLVNDLVSRLKAPSTYISRVSSVFDFAWKMGAIDRNPLDLVSKPKMKRPKNDQWAIWTTDQIGIFLEACKKDENLYIYPYFRLLITTGMRRCEPLGIFWRDFDAAGMCINLQTALSKDSEGHTTITEPKYDSTRLVAIDPITTEALTNLRETTQGNDNQRIFPFSSAAPSRWLEKIEKKTGLPHTRIHNFRHEHATVLLKSGAYLKDVMYRLGHKSSSTTLEIYAEVSADKHEILNKIPDDLYTPHYTEPGNGHVDV